MWHGIWRAFSDSDEAPWRTDAVDDEAAMPTLDAEDMRQSSLTFPEGTGIGADWLPPRSLSWLSLGTLLQVARFLMLLESLGMWPDVLRTILMHLLGKKDGGTRPIGVLPTLVRIWERARKPIAWAWREKFNRKYDFACAGGTAQEAVWRQALCDEAADGLGRQSASTLLDLKKAFEYVRLWIAWERAKQTGFPLRMMRMILEAFLFGRYLM